MPKVTANMSMSLDGMIAGPNISAKHPVHLIPILLGHGTHLFDDLGAEPIELESTGVIEGSGVTHLKFRVVK